MALSPVYRRPVLTRNENLRIMSDINCRRDDIHMPKPGRPPKTANKRDTRLSVRISTALRNKLEEAQREANEEAQRDVNGERSLSEEVEIRLRQSFETETEIEKRFGGVGTSRLLEIVADRIASIEMSSGGLHWFDDPYVYGQVRAMLEIVLDHFKPGGRRTIPKPMRLHPSLKGEAENLGRHNALLALACLESAKNDPKRNESDVPVLYNKAALPLGRRLKGSPIDELWEDRQQTRRRIFEYHGKQPPADAASEERLAGKIDAIATRAVTVQALASYLRASLMRGAHVDMAEIFEGVTGANFDAQKAVIIERIKAAAKGRIKPAVTVEGRNFKVDIDHDVRLILNADRSGALGDETIPGERYREWQRQAQAGSAPHKPKGRAK
jgi:hypothetical protein